MLRFLLVLCVLLQVSYVKADSPRVAIILDDVGHQKDDLLLLTLPPELTLAILPFTPYGKKIARLANRQERDVMLHLPMEAESSPAMEPGTLSLEMNQQQIQNRVEQAIADIPGIIGVNNHMGSRFTASKQSMDWTMEVIARHPLFFLDSRTTIHTQAQQSAVRWGVKDLRRHVFLDNIRSEEAMLLQLRRGIRLAQRQGQAVIIGHPYPDTVEFLHKHLPSLTEAGVTLAPIHKLLPEPLHELARNQAKAQGEVTSSQ